MVDGEGVISQEKLLNREVDSGSGVRANDQSSVVSGWWSKFGGQG